MARLKASEVVVITSALVAVILMVVFFETTREDAFSCLEDPLVFGVQRLQEVNYKPVYCNCQTEALGSPVLRITPEGSSQLEVERPIKDFPSLPNISFLNPQE